MTDVTVKQFATVVGIPVDRLLEQFAEAGIPVGGAEVTITEKQKMDLLAHLRKSHGNRPVQGAAAEPKRITLKRKTHSEIKMAGGGGGQIKTVSVEVRKKRTYVKRGLAEEDTSRQREPTPVELLAPTMGAEERLHHEDETSRVRSEPAVVTAVQAQPSEQEARRLAEAEEETRRLAEAEEEARRLAEAEEEARRRAEAEEEARRRAEVEEEARRRAEAEEEARRRAKQAAIPQSTETTARRVTDTAPVLVQVERRTEPSLSERGFKAGKPPESASEPKAARRRPEAPVRSAPKPRGESGVSAPGQRREAGGGGERFSPGRGESKEALSNKADRRKPRKGKGAKSSASAPPQRHGFAKPTAPVVREVALPETISVVDLAQKMSVKATEVIKTLLKMGMMVTINQMIDQETAALAVEEWAIPTSCSGKTRWKKS
jgi:translation initiation factor IF-2